MLRWFMGVLCAAIAALVFVGLAGASANATGPNISITSSTLSRNTTNGEFVYSITASADTYWGTTCTSAMCHLEIDVKDVNGSTERIDTHPANTGSGATTTYTYSGSARIGEVTDIRAHLVGSSGQVDGSWVPITDAYPDTTIDLEVNSLDRIETNGYLAWDADVDIAYWNLPDGPCPSGPCYVYLESLQSDNTTQILDMVSLPGYTTYPRTIHFEGDGLVVEATKLRAKISNVTNTVIGAWQDVVDPYPTPHVEIQIDTIHFTSDRHLIYDITGTASNFWLEDGPCRSTSWCYIEVMHRSGNGTESLFEVDAQAHDIDGRPYPDEHRFAKTTTFKYEESIGTVWVQVRGPYGTVKSEEITPKWLSPFEVVGGGNASEKGCTCVEADPVNTATGEFYLPSTDLVLPGVGPAVAVTRTYSSALRAVDGAFGYGWSTNLTSQLVVDVAGTGPLPDAVHIEQENGARTQFYNDGSGGFEAPDWVLATLEYDDGSDQWTFTRQDREMFVFDDSGLLLSVTDLKGNTVDYHYAGGELTGITGSGGREIEFTWSSGRITQIEDSAGRTVDYAYGSGNLLTVTDAAGADWDYGYDGVHRMTTQTSPEGGVVTTVYDSASRVTSQTDAVNRETTFAYADTSTTTTLPDGSITVYTFDHGDVISITEGYGTAIEATTTFGYNQAGDRTSITDPLGNVTSFTFDEHGNALTTTDPLDRTTTRTYDSLNNVTSIEDPLDRLTEMTYNGDGDLTSVTTPEGHTQSWALNADGTIASHTDARNKTTTFTYDSTGMPLCVTDADNRETCSAYDARGFITTSTDAAGQDYTFTYDDLGRVLTATDPNASVTTTTYDGDGNALTIEDGNGHVTSYSYDDADQLITAELPEGGVSTYAYGPRGGVSTVTNPVGDVTTTSYDLLNRVASVTDGESRTTIYSYDLAGRLLTAELPSTATTTNAYDEAGQLASTTNALGKVTTFAYDDAGQLVAVTDPLLRTTSTSYTDDGLVDTVTYPDTSTEIHNYNATGQEVSFTNADGAESVYTYTDSGLLASRTEPGSLDTLYTYDDAGRLEDVTTPDGHTSIRVYDDAGQLMAIDYQGSVDDVAFTYDDVGQRVTMNDATGTSTYTYDNDGRLESVENGNGQTLSYDYDAAGQLTTITYPGNNDVDYAYNDAGEMTSVTGWATGTTDYTYTPDGYLETREDPNGITETRAYDLAGQLTGITDASASTLVDYEYGYDDAGQLTSTTMTDGLHSATAQSWAYDEIGQLTTTGSGSYLASSAGFLASTPSGNTLSYNAAGQLTELNNMSTGVAITYQYDDRGARTQATIDPPTGPSTTTSYNYSESGTLQGAQSGITNVGYGLDGDGVRQSRTENSATDEYLWDVGASIPRILSDGDRYFIYGVGLTPIAELTSSQTQYLYSDNLGTPRTIADDVAAVIETADYDEFGRPIAGSVSIGFTGAITDPITGLVHLRARDYDPTSGQFTSVDPAVGVTRQPYAYVSNGPLQGTDPTGLCDIVGSWNPGPCTSDDLHLGAVNNESEIYFLLAGFATGLSENDLQYGQDSTLAQSLAYTANARNATDQLRVGINDGRYTAGSYIGSIGYDAGPLDPTNPHVWQDLAAIVTWPAASNEDRLRVALGSYNLKVTVAEIDWDRCTATLVFEGDNTSSFESLVGHQPWSTGWNAFFDRYDENSFSSVRQEYTWRETIALGGTTNGRTGDGGY